ncbi:hypothetical protein P280DRAFT_410808, partial [Massarina eburnea CBS 473.64]
ISKVFCNSVARLDDLYVGSINLNVRHLNAISSIVGLLKYILVLKHGYILLDLDFIKFKLLLKLYERDIKIFYILAELPKLYTPRNGGSVRASLNSFGYGGTNCYIILETADYESKPRLHPRKPSSRTAPVGTIRN